MLKSEVVDYFGTKAAVAEVLKISSSAVSQWGNVIPEKQAYKLERKSNGVLKVDPNFYKKS